MIRMLCALLLCGMTIFVPLSAQNSKRVKELKQQQSKLKTELQKSQSQLDKTRKQVQSGQQNVDFLGLQMHNRLSRIHQLEQELDNLEADITRLQKNITELDGEVRMRRQRLKAAVRNARALRENRDPLVFVLSAKTFGQMYRRARYAREYVAYQQNLGEQILQKQAELLDAQNLLLTAKSQKSGVLHEVMLQRKDLNAQQVQEKKKVAGLKKQESGLKGKVAEQQKQIAALDKKIEQVIAYEIEQARKKAEEEARKRAAEEAARKKKEAEKKGKTSGGGAAQKQSAKPAASTNSGSWLTAEDRQLNGSFEQNKGRLPVPITGQYMLGSRFGIYNVPGMVNVQLDNKGTNYIGRPGARARAVFDGVVSSVFQFAGTRNVLVRHGSYISVYCNLSSTIVKKGQKVKAKDILGTVADDGSGNCTLHFQLRKEKAKLNPEAWIGR
ncbi:MAG: peptidoglycan DD-metalloendopeptidase family protein [Bacteroidaceae bacterium]|nr:peptidoglycan DD-metalloendopeptidase family protein [Bacteroidaceae bacterium]